MSLRLKMAVILAGILIMSSGAAHAVNITIWDKNGVTQEDEEVEPGCIPGQVWDLEGFYFNGTTLSMVGGYDFANGLSGWESGDIFINDKGPVVYGEDNYLGAGDGTKPVTNSWGYDYAIKLDLAAKKYTLYEIADDTLLLAHYRQNDESNPWRYDSGGIEKDKGDITYLVGKSGAEVAAMGYTRVDGTNLQGSPDSHNVVSLNLQSLLAGKSFTAHFTMECGNDNLIGRVPEPGTMLLLSGFLVMSLPVIRRFRLS